MLSRLYQRLLGTPFVYEHVRPLVVGGVDYSAAWNDLNVTSDEIIVDVGCGTGDGHRYLRHYKTYYGFDTDPLAVDYARRRTTGRANVTLEARLLVEADLQRIKPDKVMLGSLLHHLSDSQALDLLGMLARTPNLKRVTTADIIPLEGRPLNNFFVRLDRGRFPRTAEGYTGLAERAGLKVVRTSLERIHPTRGLMMYFLMGLERPSTAQG
jgi:SAM-dependent methyltransferase